MLSETHTVTDRLLQSLSSFRRVCKNRYMYTSCLILKWKMMYRNEGVNSVSLKAPLIICSHSMTSCDLKSYPVNEASQSKPPCHHVTVSHRVRKEEEEVITAESAFIWQWYCCITSHSALRSQLDTTVKYIKHTNSSFLVNSPCCSWLWISSAG